MAATKRKNLYSKVSVEANKEEIDGIIEYIDSIVIEEVTDELDWRVTAKGVIPAIVSTVEDILKTALITIKDCSAMLIGLMDMHLEDDSDYIESRTESLKAKLDEIRQYYKKRPVSSIEHRRLVHTTTGKPTKAQPNGAKREMSFLVATKHKQIADRAMITKRVLETLPLLEKLDQTVSTLRGGYEVPESMEDYI